jgi:hypothetical protein
VWGALFGFGHFVLLFALWGLVQTTTVSGGPEEEEEEERRRREV